LIKSVEESPDQKPIQKHLKKLSRTETADINKDNIIVLHRNKLYKKPKNNNIEIVIEKQNKKIV
jgi:hypothetical protein